MSRHYLEPRQPFLDDRFPLPLDRPFTTAQAVAEGLSRSDLCRLTRSGLLRRPLQGVYVATQVSDSLDLRADAVRLVLPPDAVVTDRTAGWLHGASMILAPGDHLVVPRPSVFHRSRGGRFRNDLMRSGQRMLPDEDVQEIRGLPVTTPLRTVCDLGRLLPPTSAIGAMDMMARLGLFTLSEIVDAAQGFRGYRWVRQLRFLAQLVDPRSESPAESAIRLRWRRLVVPPPEPQRPVRRSPWTTYWLDLGNEKHRVAIEYDGWEFHHTPEQLARDRRRRRWIVENTDWLVTPVTRENVFGARRDIDRIIEAAFARARRLGRGRAA